VKVEEDVLGGDAMAIRCELLVLGGTCIWQSFVVLVLVCSCSLVGLQLRIVLRKDSSWDAFSFSVVGIDGERRRPSSSFVDRL